MEIKLYVTQNYEKSQINEIFKKQPIIKSRIHEGRPVWINVFNYLTFLYDRLAANFIIVTFTQRIFTLFREKVAVFCCGPKTLTKEVKSNCHSYNKLGYKFQFIHEAFN